uniref:Uncharacterized protein n=1 Tax=Hyaloperonospora arabidopsidis (strain Emoy2) TaxID=559515 RepID=M4BZJ6_HYAAE
MLHEVANHWDSTASMLMRVVSLRSSVATTFEKILARISTPSAAPIIIQWNRHSVSLLVVSGQNVLIISSRMILQVSRPARHETWNRPIPPHPSRDGPSNRRSVLPPLK